MSQTRRCRQCKNPQIYQLATNLAGQVAKARAEIINIMDRLNTRNVTLALRLWRCFVTTVRIFIFFKIANGALFKSTTQSNNQKCYTILKQIFGFLLHLLLVILNRGELILLSKYHNI